MRSGLGYNASMKRYPPRMEPPETPVLGYEGPRGRGLRFDDRLANAVIVSAVAGMLITVPALVLAVLSAGAGHGDYGFARILFPIPMCVAVFVTGSIDAPSIVLALGQFPFYGGVIAYFAVTRRRRLWVALCVLLVAHFVAFVACSESSAFS
jgi:hypothetical protein